MAHWTDGRKRSFITSALRAAFNRWPEKYAALEDAYVGKVCVVRGRAVKSYKCAHCSLISPRSNVQVDHVHPVVDPATGFETWDVYISRLLVHKSLLQVLCKECHRKKTASERALRSVSKKTK